MQRVSTIAEFNEALLNAPDEAAIYSIACCYLPRLLTADRASVAVRHKSRDEFHLITLHAPSAEFPPLRAVALSGTSIGEAIERRELVLQSNLEKSSLADAIELRKRGMRTSIHAPLVLGEEVLGCLNLASGRLRPWKTEDRVSLMHAAALVAQAVAHRRLAAQQQQETDTLAEVGRSLNAAPTEDELFKRLAEAFPQLASNADRVSVLVPVEDGIAGFSRETRAVVVFGSHGSYPPGGTYPLNGTVVSESMLERRVIVIPDLANTAYAHTANLLAMGLRSLMVAPITAGAECLGALSCTSMNAHAFDDRNQRLLGHLAGYAGSALAAIRRKARLEQALARSQELSLAKDSFLAMMSHEVRTPLNGVLATAELLKSTGLNPEQDELVEMILGSGDMLRVVLNDILDFSKIESGRMELESVPVELGALVTETTRWFHGQAKEKGLDLRVESAAIAKWVLADPTRIRQVLSNLVSNALKFTRTGSVTVSARIEAGETLILEVADTGIGIPADRLEQIFEPFRQSDSSMSRRFGGTGLGLSISQRLVKMMQGEIQVTSQPGCGSVFLVRLPVTETNPPATTPVAVAEAADFSGFGVLVVEDNHVNQRVAMRMLEQLGASVRVASSGFDALTAVGVTPAPDLIFMDVQMPEMDGLETSRRLRESGFEGTIVALTANASRDSEVDCLKAGMNGYLVKPFTREVFRKTLAQYALPPS